MSSIFQKIPFLRITLALAGGIILAKYWELNILVLIPAIVVTLLICSLLNLRYRFKKEPFFGIFILLLFCMLGQGIYLLGNRQPNFHTAGSALLTVLEKPQEKDNSYKSILQLHCVFHEGHTQTTNEKVLVYFAKTEAVKQLKAGEQILINKLPQEIIHKGTPYTFNYKSYLKNQHIYRQLYLNKPDWISTQQQKFSLPVYAELLREKLLDIYRQQSLGETETQILSALTLGYKRDLDPETKRIFSSAGAMHVLAVSGLHVGIIFMLFTFVFGFLRERKTGKWIFVPGAILLLWAYAFITGLSPSVMRAATMFSIIIVGSNLQRRACVYNSLAASAFLLMLINPNNLFEVGFQLSYAAVFGIVFLQPRLSRLWTLENRAARFAWNLLTVSLAAQMATLPLSIWYFNQFPLLFWITNFIVIPAASLLIPLGLALLLTSTIPLLASFFGFLVKYCIAGVFVALQWIESIPGSLWHMSLYPAELIFLSIGFLFLFLFIAFPKPAYFKIVLNAVFLFCLSVLTANILQKNSNEIIVHANKNTCVQLISGKKNYVISEHPILTDDYLYHELEALKHKKRLHNPVFLTCKQNYEDDLLLLQDGFVAFRDRTIVLNKLPTTTNYSPNLLVSFQHYPKFKDVDKLAPKVIVPYITLNQQETPNLYSLNTRGAFVEKW